MVPTPIALAAATNAMAGGGALAAQDIVQVHDLALCLDGRGLALIHQLHLDQHNPVILVVAAPIGVPCRPSPR